MTVHEPRTLGYYAASHWFMAAALFVMLGALAIYLFNALREAQEKAEVQIVELTLRNMRTGMQYAMAEALMRQRVSEVARWAGSNPARWLEISPIGYRGECSAAERATMPEGAWCYERASGELVYRPRNAGRLQGLDEGRPCRQLAWRVVRAADVVAKSSFVGVRIEPASSCRWVEVAENLGK